MENKQDKGFTLVELLIVIVILGILATVTVFAVRGITDQGQKSACDADKQTMETAIEAYFAQNGGTDRRPRDRVQTSSPASAGGARSQAWSVSTRRRLRSSEAVDPRRPTASVRRCRDVAARPECT